MNKNKTIDMTTGTLWDKILLFALPIAFSGILQQLFNACDTAVVGRFSSSNALAAVGSTGSLTVLLINLFIGLSVGTNVVVAKYMGQKNENRTEKAVHTSILIALICGIFLIFAGWFISKPMLKIMDTPNEIIDLATTYMRIYFMGMPFMLTYNFGSAILRSTGDTKRPMYSLIAAGVVNLCLNLFFVIVMHLSVVGVALATDISNMISSSLIIYFLMKESGPTHLNMHKLTIDSKTLFEIMKIGIPAGVQGMVFSISNVIIQRSMNGLGTDVVAGSSAALNYESFAYYILSAFGQASVTFTSQNYGAGKFDRCKKATLISTAMGMISTMIACILFIIFRKPFASFFTTSSTVIDYAAIRMVTVLSFEFLNVCNETVAGGIRGLGMSTLPAVLSIFGICGVRLLWIFFIYPSHPTFGFLLYAYPVSWIITSILLFIGFFYACKKVLQK